MREYLSLFPRIRVVEESRVEEVIDGFRLRDGTFVGPGVRVRMAYRMVDG